MGVSPELPVLQIALVMFLHRGKEPREPFYCTYVSLKCWFVNNIYKKD